MGDNLDVPKDLLEIISDIIVYEDAARDKEVGDHNQEYAYIYDYVEKEPDYIKIDL